MKTAELVFVITVVTALIVLVALAFLVWFGAPHVARGEHNQRPEKPEKEKRT